MFPVVHPGVGYLAYAALARFTGDAPPSAPATLAVVGGALLPDLVDQPLYYLFGLPSTRTLAHSLLVAVPVSMLAIVVARRTDVPDVTGVGFAVGYLAHPPADALWPLAFGEYDELQFLLWPATPSPPYEGTKDLTVVDGVAVTTTWVELALLAVAFLVWWRDGAPGAGEIRDRLRR